MRESDPEHVPETESSGHLDPPSRKPPTAIGALPGGEDPRKEITVAEFTTVGELSRLMHVSARGIIHAGFGSLGLLITVQQALPFDQTEVLAAEFGYTARLREE